MHDLVLVFKTRSLFSFYGLYELLRLPVFFKSMKSTCALFIEIVFGADWILAVSCVRPESMLPISLVRRKLILPISLVRRKSMLPISLV